MSKKWLSKIIGIGMAFVFITAIGTNRFDTANPQDVYGATAVDNMSPKLWGGTSGTSYNATDTSSSAPTSGVTFWMKDYIPNTGQIRGNGTNLTNFSMRNSTAYPGAITKVTIIVTGGTITATANTRNLILLGTSEQTATTGGVTCDQFSASGLTTITWTINPSSNYTYFKVYNIATSGSALAGASNAIQVEYTLPGSKTLSSIAVTTQPTNKNYFENQSFDPTGMVVTATYSDSSTAVVTGSCTYSPNPLTLGTTIVTVSYLEGGITQTTTITGIVVEADDLNDISINTPADKNTFSLGETFSTTGLIIDAYYDSGTIEVTSGFSVTGIDTMVLGAQTATISFEGKSTTYVVTITNENASVGEMSNATDLIISEYIEGSSNNKALEVFNGTGSPVDLSEYMLVQYNNGKIFSELSDNFKFQLSGTLNHGDVYVVANSSASTAIKAVADHINTATEYLTGFNGDDAIGLLKNGTPIDVMGTIGVQSIFAENVTLTRKSSVTSPNTIWDSNEWNSLAIDTISNLGSHVFDSADVTPENQANAFVDYVLSYGEDAEGNCEAIFSQLAEEYDFMVSESQTIFDNFSAYNEATDEYKAKERYDYLMNWVFLETFGEGAVSPLATQMTPDSNVGWYTLMSVIAIGGAVFYKLKLSRKEEQE